MTERRHSSAILAARLSAGFLGLATWIVCATTSPTEPTFQQLLDEAGLRLETPADFEAEPPLANTVLPYEHAVRHHSGDLEIRYAIRPLARISIDYEDPHSASPDPNHLFPLLFSSMTDRLSAGGDTPRREYSPQRARELFNADWAAAATFDVKQAFSERFREGLLLAIHKNGKADAYAVFLFNDFAKVRETLNASLSDLAFIP